jgi:wyosine [tRNA(Phe)-imidazoG37] synthetase (radical SAM superfamily)
MKSQSQHFIFGPVPSRRLGRSLGVDLVPFKTCSYDCIYCQLGHTTCRTIKRREWVPMHAVLDELKQKLTCRPDYITLSGSGEPTLHSRLGEIIEHIQAMTAVPVAVLTNGSLLWQKEVREELALADVVLPSLDSPDPERFEFINRPHPDITFERLVDGLQAFRREFTGQYWLEVMLLDGYTSLPPQVRQLADWTRRIRPDKVQLNTAVRPPAEEFAMAVPQARLTQLAGRFNPKAEVVAEYHQRGKRFATDANQQSILELLRRRPCTEADVACGLSMRPIEVAKQLADLQAGGLVVSQRRRGQDYYHATQHSASRPVRVGSCNGIERRGSMKIELPTSRASGRNPGKHRKNGGKAS